MENNSSKARRLKMYRRAMGIKAKEMAKTLGIDQPYYSRIENGLALVRDEYIDIARNLFIAWRKKEAKRLIEHLEYLYNIH